MYDWFKNKTFIYSGCFLLLLLVHACQFQASTSEEANTHQAAISAQEIHLSSTTDDSLISITAVGDMMLGSPYPDSIRMPKNEGAHIFDAVQKYLKGDVVFGNLEGCLLDTGVSKKCKDTARTCFAFRMPERYVKHLKNAGFNLLSLANNHINDFGNAGIQRTKALLDSQQIAYAGLTSRPIASVELLNKKLKIGFCAFAPNIGTMNINDSLLLCRTVSRLKKKHDIVIVSFHGGAEGVAYQHVPQCMELFKGEKRGDVYRFAHTAIDQGADLVLGHGPHVPRALELYKERLIVYSMGNFATFSHISINAENGLAPLFQIMIDRQGKLVSGNIISAIQTYKGLQLDNQERALHKIQNLSETDFPRSNLIFKGNRFLVK